MFFLFHIQIQGHRVHCTDSLSHNTFKLIVIYRTFNFSAAKLQHKTSRDNHVWPLFQVLQKTVILDFIGKRLGTLRSQKTTGQSLMIVLQDRALLSPKALTLLKKANCAIVALPEGENSQHHHYIVPHYATADSAEKIKKCKRHIHFLCLQNCI